VVGVNAETKDLDLRLSLTDLPVRGTGVLISDAASTDGVGSGAVGTHAFGTDAPGTDAFSANGVAAGGKPASARDAAAGANVALSFRRDTFRLSADKTLAVRVKGRGGFVIVFD
jgi:hypothetical protein